MPVATPPSATEQFYSSLPLNDMPVSRLAGEEQLFSGVPADWHVILTDIRQSTQALSDGLHHLVNLIATGSIIAALNIARKADIRMPFFFGGDGATLLVPDCLSAPVMQALTKHRENSKRNFGLDLRVGSVPVAAIYAAGFGLKIAKAKMTEEYTIPVILGQGLQYAEKIVKGGDFMPDLPEAADAALNLDGMECRWDSIKPPQDTQEVVCLLVTIRADHEQAAVCRKVLSCIDQIYGPPRSRSPVSVERLRLKPTLTRINREMRARLGRFDAGYLFENWLRTLIGFFYLRFVKEGQHYLRSLVQLSDTLVLDGRINTVMSGTAVQRDQLVEALNRMELDGEIRFGLRVCAESVMSCYVRDRRDQHVHFIDGLGGGYTQAARILKKKLAAD